MSEQKLLSHSTLTLLDPLGSHPEVLRGDGPASSLARDQAAALVNQVFSQVLRLSSEPPQLNQIQRGSQQRANPQDLAALSGSQIQRFVAVESEPVETRWKGWLHFGTDNPELLDFAMSEAGTVHYEADPHQWRVARLVREAQTAASRQPDPETQQAYRVGAAAVLKELDQGVLSSHKVVRLAQQAQQTLSHQERLTRPTRKALVEGTVETLRNFVRQDPALRMTNGLPEAEDPLALIHLAALNHEQSAEELPAEEASPPKVEHPALELHSRRTGFFGTGHEPDGRRALDDLLSFGEAVQPDQFGSFQQNSDGQAQSMLTAAAKEASFLSLYHDPRLDQTGALYKQFAELNPQADSLLRTLALEPRQEKTFGRYKITLYQVPGAASNAPGVIRLDLREMVTGQNFGRRSQDLKGGSEHLFLLDNSHQAWARLPEDVAASNELEAHVATYLSVLRLEEISAGRLSLGPEPRFQVGDSPSASGAHHCAALFDSTLRRLGL